MLNYIFAFILYVFFQVMFFNYLVIGQVAIPFVFLLFLLMLPFTLPTSLAYVLAFSMGLIVDILSETYANGLHAFSALLAMSLRPFVARLISPNVVRNLGEISLASQNTIWYASYLFPLIFVHHFAYFFLDAFSFGDFFFTLFRVLSSSLYTFLLCFILCYIFYRK